MKLINFEKEDKLLGYLTILLLVGVLLMSLGIYLVGIHFPQGNILVALGSTIIYLSVIILAIKN